MNYKIRVANKAESKEVQGLFFEMGYKWIGIGAVYYKISPSLNYITAYCEGKTLAQGHGLDAKKEITIPQLKGMVVLKRNDVADATHKCIYDNIPEYFMASDGVLYFYENTDWVRTKNTKLWCDTHLKPITKEPVMKEYLNKLEDGTYKLVVLDSVADGVEGLIEIPEGAFAMSRGIGFYKMRGDEIMVKHPDAAWRKSAYEKISTIKGLAWQRETLNDKVASAEVARQEFIGVPFSDLPAFNFGAVDDFVESNVEQGAKHSHYKKDISHLDTLDIYRVTELFNPHSCGAHIAKKALCSGQRGHKDLLTDIQDIIDTAERWKEMLIEDEKAK